jgi:hypothetical protein
MDYAQWLQDKPSCIACKTIHERKGDEAPCGTCIPPLSEKYEPVIRVYELCKNQVICGPSSIIDLNLGTVIDILNIMPILNKEWVLRQVHKMFNQNLEQRLAKE